MKKQIIIERCNHSCPHFTVFDERYGGDRCSHPVFTGGPYVHVIVGDIPGWCPLQTVPDVYWPERFASEGAGLHVMAGLILRGFNFVAKEDFAPALKRYAWDHFDEFIK